MELDDLRFSSRDVRNILVIAVGKRKVRHSSVDINYGLDSATITYSDLMKIAEKRGLNQDVVRGIIEEGSYKICWRKLIRENIDSGLEGFTVGFIIGGAMGLGLKIGPINPVIYGAGATIAADILTHSLYNQGLKKVVRNDIGTFLGQTAGYFLAYLS